MNPIVDVQGVSGRQPLVARRLSLGAQAQPAEAIYGCNARD